MTRSSLLSCFACLALVACSGTPRQSPTKSPTSERDLLLDTENASLSKSLEGARPLVDLAAQSGMTDTSAPAYQWIELGAGGMAIARVLTTESDCPDIRIGEESQPMARRSTSPPGFEVLTCQAIIPKGTVSASIGDTQLPLPAASPKRIVVVGDTGCRIKGKHVQNCSGEGSGPPWAFARVARAIEALQPDLIIHVGDYLYRESPCPEGDPGCAGTPHGDNWITWNADFFQPAAPALSIAPWVFARGNHEDCGRAWKGWFLFLEPRDLGIDSWKDADCPQYTQPYRLPLGDLDLLVMDTAQIPGDYSPTPDPAAVTQYRGEFDRIDDLVDRTTWLLTHRPFWAAASYRDSSGQAQLGITDLTLQTALQQSNDGRLPTDVRFLLAGHVHNFEMLQFSDGRPPQMVSGGGGTKLDPPITEKLLASNPQVLSALQLHKQGFTAINVFSFALVEPSEAGWSVTIRNVDGETIDKFAITNP